MNDKGVFATNELDLEEVDGKLHSLELFLTYKKKIRHFWKYALVPLFPVYGFDYDYTVACYKKSLNYLLYDLGRDNLVSKYKVSLLDFELRTI